MTTKQSIELRVQSGTEKTSSNFIMFLYHLLRDHLPAGKVEYMIDAQVFNDGTDDVRQETLLTNGFIARYAKNIVMRLSEGHTFVYKVRDKHTGQFLDGGDEYELNDTGRGWHSFSTMKKYLTGMRRTLKGMPDHYEVVKYALVEVESTPVMEACVPRAERKSFNKFKVIEYTDEKP